MSPQRDADAEPAQWLPVPAWCARVLDLRMNPGTPLPENWHPSPDSFITSVPAASEDTPWMAFHKVDSQTTRTGYTLVVTLHSRGAAAAVEPSDTVAMVLTGTTLNDVWLALSFHGLDLRRLSTSAAADRIGGVHAGLLDPNSWHPGLAGAALTPNSVARTALASLLAVGHTRVPNSVAAKPFMHLYQVFGAQDIAIWLDSDLPLGDIPVLAEVFDDPEDCKGWVEAFDDAITAALWRYHGPNAYPDRLARLHQAGWQPPTALAAVQMLDSLGRVPSVEPAEEALWFANLPVSPAQALLVIRAGIRAAEMWALIEKTPGGVGGIDWDALSVMAALRVGA